jgi:hypothetical protein
LLGLTGGLALIGAAAVVAVVVMARSGGGHGPGAPDAAQCVADCADVVNAAEARSAETSPTGPAALVPTATSTPGAQSAAPGAGVPVGNVDVHGGEPAAAAGGRAPSTGGTGALSGGGTTGGDGTAGEPPSEAPVGPTVPAPAPTPAPTAAPTPPPTADDGTCATACGSPRYFCDTWAGGYCNDFRQLGDTSFEVPYPPASEPISFDCLSSTSPDYLPTMNTQNNAEDPGVPVVPFPCAFSKHEHFMTRMEDGNFGMVILRFQRPFDFSGREGHIHFDVDLKNSTRRYVRMMLSPQITKSLTDDRGASLRRPLDALDVWFRGGGFDAQISRGGGLAWETNAGTYHGRDDVRDHVDVYVSRTHVRVVVNGDTYIDTSMPDVGFDRAYLYLAQVAYNPCKDHECDLNLQIFHWDNVAFDGPTLGVNALTPPGMRDVAFNAYRANSCTLRGQPTTPMATETDGNWVTWTARIPDDGSPVSAGDIACDFYGAPKPPEAIEIVRPGG